jgi:ribosome-associated protein
MIQVTHRIQIDEKEIEESFVRSSGPGGQNVNKVESAVQLRFDARRSPSLPDDVSVRLQKLAGSRLTLDGVIVIIAQTHRSQERNRAEALDRLVALIREAAKPPPPKRRPTKPTKGSKERRLEGKGKRGEVKKLRSGKPGLDG